MQTLACILKKNIVHTALILGIVISAQCLSGQSNPIVLENQQPGSASWEIDTAHVGTDSAGQIKGYASSPSVNKGGNITFFVSTNPPQTFSFDVFRVGWYQGLGARLMQHVGPLNGVTQPTCPMDTVTGMIECQWAPSYTLATQSSWTSGVYLVLMKNEQGYQNYIMFVVTDDNRVAPLLYQQGVATYQAYNNYPNDGRTGKSLYDFNSYGSTLASSASKGAVKVSFDRPYSDIGVDPAFFSDNGEVNFIRFVERSGYDIAYSTNLETHASGNRLLNYRGFLSVGHDEYWSKQMYDAAEAARDAGVNLAFFGADAVYWQIRFEPSTGGVPNRVVVCYKDSEWTSRDPITDPNLKTVLWRDPPVNRPEQRLIGVQYTSMVPYNNGNWVPHIVTHSDNWVYAGTGLRDGDSIPSLVGYEGDRYFSQYAAPIAVPGTYVLLSQSPYTSAQGPDYANSSVYQAPSGAWVFGTGSMNWNWGLDTYQHGTNVADARVQRATANILDRFIANAQPDFSIASTPTNRAIAPGGSTSYDVVITAKGGFTGSVSLSVSGLPNGVTGVFSTNPAVSTSTLTIQAPLTTPVGVYTLTITGESGGLTRTSTTTLSIALPDFSLSASPTNRTVAPGGTTSYDLSIASISGFSSPVTLSISGLPTGASASFATNPATVSSTLTVVTSTATPTGNYTLTINGLSGSLSHTANVTLSVAVSSTVTVDSVGPSAAGAAVTGGSSLTWNHSVSTTGSNLLLTVAVAVGKSPDTGLSLTATYAGVPMTSAGLVHSNSRTSGFVQLFYLKAPSTGANAVQVVLSGGTADMEGGSVSFTGVDQTTPIRNITSATGNGTSPSVVVASAPGNMVVDALASGCNGGITSLTTARWIRETNCATGAGNGAQSTAAGALAVTMGYTIPSDWWGVVAMDVVGAGMPSASPDFALTASPANQTVVVGGSTTYGLTITPSGGFSSPVTLSVAGLPTGVTATFSPNPTTTSSTLSIVTSSSAVGGSYPLSISGTSGSLTHGASVTLNISSGLTVTAPNTAVSWKATSKQNITFTHNLGTGQAVNISVSRDGGTTWSPITTYTTTSATTGTYSWTVSGPATTQARIRVSSATNAQISDTSDVNFTITNPSITVTAPNTAVSWRVGETRNITFTHDMGTGQTVNIQVSRDAGATWSQIATFTTTSATSGSYSWLVSGPATNSALIRVAWIVDASVSDQSNVTFKILPRVTVTAPNTAVTYGAGSKRTVSWTHNLGLGGTVNIDFSPDSGATWTPLAQNIASSAATSGSYVVAMPTTATSKALIRVSPTIEPTSFDTSDVTFTLANPSITVTAPNTNANWAIGATKSITWSHNLGTLEAVTIQLARDGVNYTETIAPSINNSANASATYSWLVTGPATTTARVRVTWLTNTTVTDISNVNFKIQ